MNDWKPMIIGIEYLLQFKNNPLSYVDKMADAIIQKRGIDFPVDAVISSVSAMEDSNEDISFLLPQPHSNECLRQFFRELSTKLQQSRRV